MWQWRSERGGISRPEGILGGMNVKNVDYHSLPLLASLSSLIKVL